jgi:hypothetical protein
VTPADTKQEWLRLLGYFWQNVFLDSEFVDAYCTSIAVPVTQLNQEVSHLPDYVSRHLIPIGEDHPLRLFIIDEAQENRDAHRYGEPGPVYGGNAFYGEQTDAPTNRRFAFDTTFLPQFLTTGIVNPQAVLRLNVDYFFEPGWITFRPDIMSLPGLQKRATSTGAVTTYEFLFWGFQTLENLNAISAYFGTIAGIVGPSSRWMFDAMNVAWDIRQEGASVKNITKILGLTASTEYVDQSGTVRSVGREGDRLCVFTDTAAYTAPLTATALVQRGDRVSPGDIIFDSFAVHLATDFVPFIDFEGLVLGSGYIAMVPNELLFVNTEVPLTRATDGTYSFFLGGQSADVQRYLAFLNNSGRSPDFFEMLAQKYGRVPTSINPYLEVKDMFFKNSAFFIKVRVSNIGSREVAQLFNILKRTVPAGAGFFVIFEKTILEEVVRPGASEIVDVFYLPDFFDESYSGATETVLATPVV